MKLQISGKVGCNETVLIDDADYPLVSQHKWYIQYKTGQSSPKVKAMIYQKGGKLKCLYLHRFLMGAEQGIDVDHINGNGLDNRRSNLRLCTRTQNHANRRKPSRQRAMTSQYKGVSVNAKGRFVSQIAVHGKTSILGIFTEEVDAALAYNAAALEIFGEFAAINVLFYRRPRHDSEV